VHAEVADPRDQAVQHVDGGAGVVQRAVVGGGGRLEEGGERGELVVAGLVAVHELAGEVDGVEDREARPLVASAARRGLEEGDVEAGVVGH
jgi:hypothetical protein